MNLSSQLSNGALMFFSLMVAMTPVLLLALIFVIPFCPDSACDSYWKRLPYNMLQLLGVPLVFFIITMCVLIAELKGYFSEHFDEYKCKPWFMPFVSLVRSDVTVTDNAGQCLANVSRVVNSRIASPMLDIAADLSNSQNIQVDNLSKMHHQLQRKSTETGRLLIHMNNHLGGIQSVGKVLMIKLGTIFSNTMALVYDMYYMLVSLASFCEQAIMAPQIILILLMYIGVGSISVGVAKAAYALATQEEAIAEEVAGDVAAASWFEAFMAPVFWAASVVSELTSAITTTLSIASFTYGFLLTGLAVTFSVLLGIATEKNNALIAHERLVRSMS